jgi:DNA-binding NarL/FixJ family response regulator
VNGMVAPLTILLVDDFVPFRAALRNSLEQCAGVTIVGEAGDGYSAMETAFRLVPRIIVMDVKMPRLNGVEVTRRIKRVLPNVHIIGVSSMDDTTTRDAMKAVGCSAFMGKDMAYTLPGIIAEIISRQIVEVCLAQESGALTVPTGQ